MLEAQAQDNTTVEDTMAEAARLNITVMRIFATGVDPEMPLMEEPGNARGRRVGGLVHLHLQAEPGRGERRAI